MANKPPLSLEDITTQIERFSQALESLNQLPDAVTKLRHEVAELSHSVNQQTAAQQSMNKMLQEHELTIYGSNRPKVLGLTERVELLDAKIDRAVNDLKGEITNAVTEIKNEFAPVSKVAADLKKTDDERKKLIWGMVIGLGVNGAGVVGIFAALLRLLAGVPP
jgi:uncharacterized protein YoxC